MPPHCDSLDGPVVTAARHALDADDVDIALAFVPEDVEAEVRAVFECVRPVRDLDPRARDVADRLFFETVVRLHRAGEGAPYTGLKPAGQPVGAAIPLAEEAVRTGSAEGLAGFLAGELRGELDRRLASVRHMADARDGSVRAERRYVETMLGFEVYSHHVMQALQAPTHH